jgi:hypothetical protein
VYYIGVDVSWKESTLCILDGKGKIVRETKLPTDLRDYRTLYRRYRACSRADRLGIGLYRSLVVCQAAAAWLAGDLHRCAAGGSGAASWFPQQERS